MRSCFIRIGYVRNNRTVKANCLKLRPRWMDRERASIGDIPLHALMIPGSHNAGAYKITDVSRSLQPRTISVSDKGHTTFRRTLPTTFVTGTA